MRYDRARKNPGRYPNYIPAAYMASAPDYRDRLPLAKPGEDARHCR